MSKNTKKTLWLIAFGVVLFCACQNIERLGGLLSALLALLTPFLIGGAVAFVMNVPMGFIEGKLLKKMNKGKRPVAILLTVLFLLCLLTLVIFLIVPELGRTVRTLKELIPGFLTTVEGWIAGRNMPDVQEWLKTLQPDWGRLSQALQTGATGILHSTVNAATSLVNGVVDTFIGLVFAVYLLAQKENLASQTKRFCYAFLPERRVDKLLSVTALANRTFSDFITGQCTEAVILGGLFFIGMSLFRFPYALMISVLIGFLSLIPIFGAFIGLLIGSFLILMVSPLKALWFILFFLILQQLEGNLIYPRVVGNSIGLPAIWVLTAVTIGSSTLGILGVFLFIPLFSVVYQLIKAETAKRLTAKRQEKEAE